MTPPVRNCRMTVITGLRVGELLGLPWADTDFHERTLNVNRSWSRLMDGTHELKGPKTRQSYRDSPSPEADTAEDAVLRSEAGTLIDSANYRRVFNKIITDGAFNEDLTPRSMHKTHGNWISRNFPVKVIADRLGHGTQGDTTLDHYLNTPEGMDREVAEWLDERLPAIEEGTG